MSLNKESYRDDHFASPKRASNRGDLLTAHVDGNSTTRISYIVENSSLQR